MLTFCKGANNFWKHFLYYCFRKTKSKHKRNSLSHLRTPWLKVQGRKIGNFVAKLPKTSTNRNHHKVIGKPSQELGILSKLRACGLSTKNSLGRNYQKVLGASFSSQCIQNPFNVSVFPPLFVNYSFIFIA